MIEVRIYKRKTAKKKRLIVSWSTACFLSFFFFFLDRFLGRKGVFLFSYFLVFFYKFPPLLCTGCSLNIVFFKLLKYSGLLPFYVFSRCQCVYAHQAGRTPALQQNWQSLENSKNLKDKHNI